MELVNRYESRKSPIGTRQALADDIKMSILEGMCPAEAERHLQLNRSKFLFFDDMHSELATYLETRVGVKLKIEPLGSSKRGEDDMEIGAFGKGGKGKGKSKGKGGKNKGKEIKEKVRVKTCQRMEKVPVASLAQISAAVVCFNCGKPGHMQRDCRAPKQNNNSSSNKGKGKGGNKGKKKSVNNVEENNQQTEPEAETGYLELAMLGATSEDKRPAEGEQPVPDVGLPKETRKAAQRRYRRLLKVGTRLTWTDLPVTRYRQRLAASIDAARIVKGSVGQWMAKKVLERENLDDTCSSCDERSKPSTVAAMEYATKRAQAKRMSSGAYDVLREEAEEEPDDVEDSEEPEDEEVQEIEQEDEDEGEEADDEGADEDDKRQEEYLRAYEEISADEESREKILGTLAEARALLDEGQMPAMEEKKPKEKSSGSTGGMDAVLPDSGRAVTPVTSVLMHGSIEIMETGKLTMEKNKLTQYLEEAEDEESAKGIEAQIKEVDIKLKTMKGSTHENKIAWHDATTLGITEQLLPVYLIARHGERRKDDDVHIYTVNWVGKTERRKEEGWTHFGPQKNWLVKASKQRLSTPLEKECKCCKEERNQKDTKKDWRSEDFKDEPSKSSHRKAKKMRRKWWNGKGWTSLQKDQRRGLQHRIRRREMRRRSWGEGNKKHAELWHGKDNAKETHVHSVTMWRRSKSWRRPTVGISCTVLADSQTSVGWCTKRRKRS